MKIYIFFIVFSYSNKNINILSLSVCVSLSENIIIVTYGYGMEQDVCPLRAVIIHVLLPSFEILARHDISRERSDHSTARGHSSHV